MREIIKKHSDFIMPPDTPSVPHPFFITRCRQTKWPESPKYGIIASKKTFKHATDRNRAKRLLRVWIRECDKDMSRELDFVFIARKPILDAKLPEGIAAVKRAAKKLATSNE